jgi:hypothetical protein
MWFFSSLSAGTGNRAGPGAVTVTEAAMKSPTALLMIAFALVVGGGIFYSLFWRERPQQQGRVTGDFEQARALANELGSEFVLAVDAPPH